MVWFLCDEREVHSSTHHLGLEIQNKLSHKATRLILNSIVCLGPFPKVKGHSLSFLAGPLIAVKNTLSH